MDGGQCIIANMCVKEGGEYVLFLCTAGSSVLKEPTFTYAILFYFILDIKIEGNYFLNVWKVHMLVSALK